MVTSMNKLVNYVFDELKDCGDLIYKKINVQFNTVHLFYLETLSSGDRINDYILKGISNNSNILNIMKSIPSPHFILIDNKDKIEYYLFNGYAIIIVFNKIYGIEAKADLDRSITESTTEPSLYGPKDSFVENIQKNLGLVKRRLKTRHLKHKVNTIGRDTKTIINILYIDNITDMKLVKDIEKKIKNIDIDGILDAGVLKKHLGNNKNPFPIIKLSERPDLICTSLLNGKLVILVDNSPFALILPSFLADYFNPNTDN